MNKHSIQPILVAAGLLAALPVVWAAPGDPATPAAAPAAATPVRGQVTAVDATAKTVTLQNPRTQATTVLHVSDSTKYLVDATGAVSDVQVGQTVRVIGQTTGNTITARRIQVVPAEEANLPVGGRPGGQGGGQGGGRRGGVQGVVATVTPSLTITTADKQTDTVQTDSTTRVTTSHSGTLADVKPQTNVNALTTGSGDNITATLIHVSPAGGFGGRGQGGGRRGGAGGNGGAGATGGAAGQ